MNKTFFKVICIIIVTVIFLYAFSSSYVSNSIDNIAYVTAIAVDLSEDTKNLQVTFEFMSTSSFAGSESSEVSSPTVDTVISPSINSAINLLNSYVGKQLNLSHCKVIVFSDELAKRGISFEITELINNIQIRPTTNFIISKCKASEYLKKSTSSLEKILIKYYEIFPNSSEYTGYTSNIMIGNLYKHLSDSDCGNLAILGGLTIASSNSSTEQSSSESSSGSESSGGESSGSESSGSESSGSESSGELQNKFNISLNSITAGNAPIVGDRGTENIGLAVFKNASYIGELSALDTLCHTLIKGEVESFLLTIDNPEIYKNYMDVNLFVNNSPSISIDTSSDNPVINIDIKLVGRIVGIKSELDIVDPENDFDLNEISNAVNKHLKNILLDYLNKTSSEFQVDIDDFYSFAKKNFLTNDDWKDYNWADKYLNSEFNVSVDSNVFYSLLSSD